MELTHLNACSTWLSMKAEQEQEETRGEMGGCFHAIHWYRKFSELSVLNELEEKKSIPSFIPQIFFGTSALESDWIKLTETLDCHTLCISKTYTDQAQQYDHWLIVFGPLCPQNSADPSRHGLY